MDKSLYKYLSQVQAMDNDPNFVEPEKSVKNDSDLQRVLDSIFAVDPKTGLPKSDIQYYLSPDGNPQVREWLINNLMKPRMSKNNYSTDNLTDDLIVEFSRQTGESVEAYAMRLQSLGDEARNFFESNQPKEAE